VPRPNLYATASEDVERNHVAARVSTLNERDVVPLPHFLKDGRAKIRHLLHSVYNPVWTNPDGFSGIEMLTDPDLVGCYIALTPTGMKPPTTRLCVADGCWFGTPRPSFIRKRTIHSGLVFAAGDEALSNVQGQDIKDTRD